MSLLGQTFDVFELVKKTDTFAVKLSRELASEVVQLQNKKEIQNFTYIKVSPISFFHNEKKFEIELCQDFGSGGLVVNNSFIKIRISQGNDFVYFKDYLLNGNCDEYHSHDSYFMVADLDQEIQAKFILAMKEALSFFRPVDD